MSDNELLHQDSATAHDTATDSPAVDNAGADTARSAVFQRKVAKRAEGTLQLKAGNNAAAPSGSESSIADHGFSGAAGSLPHASDMRAGFKQDFGNVEVHAGTPEAKAATSALGAEAYAVGNKVAFKSENPGKEVVAHELAHTIQQSGGSRGVQTFAASSPDHLEKEADAAAATVVSGGTADIMMTTGSGGIHKWAGSDHYSIGNLGGQKALNMFHGAFPDAQKNLPKTTTGDVVHGGTNGEGGMTTGHNEQQLAIGTGPGTQISAGESSRFSGDYAQSPEKLKGRNQEGGSKSGLLHPVETYKAAAEESAMVFGASTNSNHFYPINGFEYANHHAQAVQLAAAGQMDAAMQQEGFAIHFLQDTFSSGHMAPRSLDSVPHLDDSHDWLAKDARDGLMRTKTWHDFFCMLPTGLPTNRGRFHGDNYMDGNDLEVVSNAVADSLFEVLSAGQGKGVSRNVGSQIQRPDLDAILADPVAGPAWKLMQDAYRADFQKAQKTIKQGQTSTTDGGTTYDSKNVVDLIGQNVMGAGTQAAPTTKQGVVKLKKDAVVGTLTNIQHYLTADFDAQIFLHLDDDMKPAQHGSPHFKLQELESKFKFFSTGVTQTNELCAALRDYQAQAQGDAKSKADTELATATQLQQQFTNWQKLAVDAGSWTTWLPSTVQKYRTQIDNESRTALQTLGGWGDLPPDAQNQDQAHANSQNAGPGRSMSGNGGF